MSFKPVEELTFTDDFMFTKVMKNKSICKGLLERLLGIKISKIEYPEIQKFVGALAGKSANKGVFITTSSFSKEAREYVKGLTQKVVLIDGKELANYMIEFNVGVALKKVYEVKRIDIDYFEE